jgi:prophage antirepressor-like protein
MIFLVPFFNTTLCQRLEVLVIDGEHWFRVADIARMLNYSDGRNIDFEGGEMVVFKNTDLPGVNIRTHKAKFIRRSSLVKALSSVDRLEAGVVGGWLAEEVLPCLDSTDFNVIDAEKAFAAAMFSNCKELRERRNLRYNTLIRGGITIIDKYLDTLSLGELRNLEMVINSTISSKGTTTTTTTTGAA